MILYLKNKRPKGSYDETWMDKVQENYVQLTSATFSMRITSWHVNVLNKDNFMAC